MSVFGDIMSAIFGFVGHSLSAKQKAPAQWGPRLPTQNWDYLDRAVPGAGC